MGLQPWCDMEWQEALRRRRGGVAGGRAQNPKLAALAEELAAALKPKPRSQLRAAGPKHQKPEWECSACTTPNFLDRTQCRRCKQPRNSGAEECAQAVPASGPRLPPGSVWADVEPKTPAARAAALEKAAVAAKAAGASEAVAEALAADVAEARKKAVSSKPLGARIDSARARLRRTESKLTSSREALERAQATYAEACAHRDTANADLQALEKECAVRGTSTPDGRISNVLSGAKELLLKLESSPLVHAQSLEAPEPLLAAMRALHAAIAEAAPEPELDMSLDGGDSDRVEAPAERAEGMSSSAEPKAPSEPAGAFPDAAFRGGASDGVNNVESLDLSGDEMVMEDAALGALVRERLLKRQRHSPY